MDFESEHDVAVEFQFDPKGFFRERFGRGAGGAAGGGVAQQAGVVHVRNDSTGSSRSGGSGGVSEMAETLPAYELAPSQSRMQGLPQQQPQVVAELDGGGVPEYRGVVGVAR